MHSEMRQNLVLNSYIKLHGWTAHGAEAAQSNRTLRHSSFAGHTNCPWMTAILRKRMAFGFSCSQTQDGAASRSGYESF